MKLALLALITFASFYHFDSTNFTPLVTEEKGVGGVVEASCILFFSYAGFDFLTTLSPETKNPIRDIPIAIELTVVISACLYALIAFALNGVGNIADLGSGGGETAISEIFSKKGMPIMALTIYVTTLLGVSASTMTNLMSQSRMLFSYAKDGLFFKVFKELDPVKKVPLKGSWIAIVPIALAGFYLNLK